MTSEVDTVKLHSRRGMLESKHEREVNEIDEPVEVDESAKHLEKLYKSIQHNPLCRKSIQSFVHPAYKI